MVPNVISTKEAASLMQLSEQRIRTLLKNKKIKGEQFGKQWLVDKSALIDFLKSPENQINPPDRKRTSNEKPNLISLSFFSGAMGLDIGLKKCGITPLLACEFDKRCRQTIAANNPEIGLIGDIWDYSAEQIRDFAGISNDEEIDLIVGGPPCQAFSTAGNRLGLADTRGNALLRYVDLIGSLKPKYAVIENVRGLLSAALVHRPHSERDDNYKPNENEKPGGALSLVLDNLKNFGYKVSFNLYNSANFGTPQIRERVIIICYRGDEELPYLEPTHSDNPIFGLPPFNSFKDAVHDLDTSKMEYIKFPEARLKYYRKLSAGQNWKNLSIEDQKAALGNSFHAGGGKTGFFRRISWDKPAPTLLTHPAMPATDLAHPVEDRPLSIEEYKRIQQFPDDWIICGNTLDKYKQLGNAVPAGLGEAIGKLIINHIQKNEIKSFKGFKYSRYKETDHVSWMKKNSI